MNILHLSSNYTDTILYQKLSDSLSELGIEQTVLAPNSYNNSCDFSLNSNVKVLKCYGKYDRLFYHMKQKKIYNAVIKAVDVSKFDLIHAHLLFTNGYCAYKIKKKYNIPYIVAVRNTDVNTFFKYMIHLRSLGVKILCNAERIIFLSKAYMDCVLSNYVPKKYLKIIRDKSVVIPNGIDEFWHNNASRHEEDKELIRVITVGNVENNKNQLLVCQALNNLVNRGYAVQYDVIGRKKDYDYGKKLEVYDFYHYHMPCPKEELIEYYRNSDVFVLASHFETFGLVYPEAMSQGLPVIYTVGQGFDKQYPEGYIGYSVSDCDCTELEHKILLVKKKYKELSSNCLIGINKFKWSTIAEEYRKIYSEIISS